MSGKVNGVFVVPPDRGILHAGTKTFRPAEHKITETGSKSVPSESLGLTVI